MVLLSELNAKSYGSYGSADRLGVDPCEDGWIACKKQAAKAVAFNRFHGVSRFHIKLEPRHSRYKQVLQVLISLHS